MLQLQQQQRRGGGGGGGTNVSAAVARALASSQPLPRARSARISLRRLEAIMERSLMTTFCRSESEQQSSNNRGGIAESSNAAANRGVDSSDGALPPPRPSPAQKKKSRMRLDEAASLVAGCETVSGLEMFVGQAALQFELFFPGVKAPVELMREAVLESVRREEEEE